MSTRERLSAEDRKRQICGVAKEVFLSTGFENATMEDIMKAAGLSKGGLYHHYKSTHDILYDIMMMGNEHRNEVIMEFVSANSNLSKKDIIVELIRFSTEMSTSLYMLCFCSSAKKTRNTESSTKG